MPIDDVWSCRFTWLSHFRALAAAWTNHARHIPKRVARWRDARLEAAFDLRNSDFARVRFHCPLASVPFFLGPKSRETYAVSLVSDASIGKSLVNDERNRPPACEKSRIAFPSSRFHWQLRGNRATGARNKYFAPASLYRDGGENFSE